MMQRFFFLSLLLVSLSVHAQEGTVSAPLIARAGGKKTPVVAKVAVVDFQKIINFDEPAGSASLEWRDIMAELEKKLKPRMNRLQDMQAKLQKDAKEAREQMRNDDDTAARLMKMQNDIEIDAKSYQSYSQKALAEVQTSFGEKVKAVVEEVAAEQGWTHVFPGPLLYSLASCDITDDVVERMNKNYREELRKKKFAASQKNA